ncbi:hypothetical protein U1Q18_051874 [Sarracenia purpurea var. burkii]
MINRMGAQIGAKEAENLSGIGRRGSIAGFHQRRRSPQQLLMVFMSFGRSGDGSLVCDVDELLVTFVVFVFILMGGHVSSEVMPFAKTLVANRAFELILISSAFIRVYDIGIVFMMRTHMVD